MDKNLTQPNSLETWQMPDLYRIQVREFKTYAMFMIDRQGIITTWNAGVEHLLGYSEDEWVGQHACLIFTPEERAEEVCDAEMNRALESGAASDIRWHRRKDGTEFFANGVMSALHNEAGEVIGFSKIMSDETARKQLQDSLTESNAALEQFAYVASHDLQEPIRTIRVYAQLLSKKYSGRFDPEADKFLAFIDKGAGRMVNLVQDLLDYARLAREIEPPPSIALDEDLEAALTHLDAVIRDSGAVVTHDPLPTLVADRGQMVRLFQNLIGNSIKYRKPDERVKIHVGAVHEGQEWIISVRDNGMGFDPQYASSIFAPFKRLNPSSDYPGTGVGLAICRRIVQAHGGRIWAEAVAGKGATLSFTLPG